MTAQPQHSQCPLVELDSITSLFIVYRYDSTTGTFTVPSGGGGFYYDSVYCLQIQQQTGKFTVPLVEVDSIASLFIGDGLYCFSVYCLQIRQHNWNINSALWWRWILLLLCLLFTDMTAQRNIHSAPWWRWILLHLCLLFTDTTTQLEYSQFPWWRWILLRLCLLEMACITSLFIVYRYDSTTTTFTVPSGGAGFYYFSVYCLQIRQHNRNIHSALWWRWILLLLCLLFTDMTAQLEH